MNSSNKTMVPEAQDAMNRFKMEAANEVGVNLKQGYNGDLTSREAGSVGGQKVKKMIKSYEQSKKKKTFRQIGDVRQRASSFCVFIHSLQSACRLPRAFRRECRGRAGGGLPP